MLKKMMLLMMTFLFAFSLTGCKDKNANKTITYDETDLGKTAGLDMVYYARVNTRDQLVVLVMNDTREVSLLTLDKAGKEVHRLNTGLNADEAYLALDKQDNLFLLIQNYVMDGTENMKEITRQLIQYDTNGKEVHSSKLDTFIPGDGYSGLGGFEADLAGNVYLLKRMGSVEVFDENGKLKRSIGSQNYSCMTMDSDEGLILGYFGEKGKDCILEKINTPEGKSVWKKNLNQNDAPRFIVTGGTDPYIHVLTNRGVKKYSSTGEEIGYWFDTLKTSLSGFDSFITDMDMDSTGCYYFTVSKKTEEGNIETILYKFTPAEEKNETETNQTTLTLASTEQEYFLDNAISEFQKKNPDIRIEKKEYSTGKTEEDFSNFVMTLNTELLSNNGPDIISTKNLPNYIYCSRGFYADLSRIMAQDNAFNINQYNTNLFDSFKYKGTLYVIPISVTGEAIAANQTILDEENIVINDENWTWKDYVEICKRMTKDADGDGTPERYAIPFIGPSTLLMRIFANNSDQFIDMENRKAYLDSAEFIGVLKLVKEFWDSGVICPNVKTYDSQEARYDLYDRNGIVFVPETVFSYSTMGIYSENTVFLQPPSVNGEYKPAYYSELFAINEESKYRKEAWEFIKFLLSEDIQKRGEINGFPVSREAIAFKRNEDRNTSETGRMRVGSGDRRVLPLTDTMLSNAERFITETGFLSLYDQRVNLIIINEASPFFHDEKSAEEAAKIIQYKVGTYLNE